jgi:5-methylcytosine-specific restriction endonuclease McrA
MFNPLPSPGLPYPALALDQNVALIPLLDPMAFPKPRSHRAEKRDRRAQRRAVIGAVRAELVNRDRRCRVCGGLFGWGEATAEMHELVPRSRLRGRSPEEIFNRQNCLLLHRRCHREVTEHRLILAPADASVGAEGRVEVKTR